MALAPVGRIVEIVIVGVAMVVAGAVAEVFLQEEEAEVVAEAFLQEEEAEVVGEVSLLAEEADIDKKYIAHRAMYFFNVQPAYYGGREVCPIALCSITGAQVQGRTLPCPSPVLLWQF